MVWRHCLIPAQSFDHLYKQIRWAGPATQSTVFDFVLFSFCPLPTLPWRTTQQIHGRQSLTRWHRETWDVQTGVSYTGDHLGSVPQRQHMVQRTPGNLWGWCIHKPRPGSWRRMYDVGGNSFLWGSEEIIQRSGIICTDKNQCYFKTWSHWTWVLVFQVE